MIIQRDPICLACGRRASTQVDHIKNKASGGTDDPENLRGICGPCHKRKTALEGRAGVGSRKPH